MKRAIILLLFLLFSISIFSQTISRIEPPNWWTGMKWNTVTLLIYGDNISDLQPSFSYTGVELIKAKKVENNNYLFLTIKITSAAIAGNIKIDFKSGDKIVLSKNFPLLSKQEHGILRNVFSMKDAILLILPDRFSNGDTRNDVIPGMSENTVYRKKDFARHGGDIQGIINHLNYIKSLGFTQIWNTPLVENNQPRASYHGYAATDFYKIDPRFGTNELFKTFVEKAKQKGIGVIWDVVLNHCGDENYFIKDMPFKDWANYPDSETQCNFEKSTVFDPYATKIDKKEYVDGWFSKYMPDLNQRNPLMASYLIQNTIWWVEYSGISGLRIDTFSYSDKSFLTEWTKAILAEYPGLNMVGEEMTTRADWTSYWQIDKVNMDGYKCFLPTLMDFALTDNVIKSLSYSSKWFSSWRDTYEGIAEDYLFPHPNNQMIFPDNHDIDRFFSRLNKSFDNWKLGIALYMAMRGIPQFYYGTEVLMTNKESGNDGQRRGDFYGGWVGDSKNAFSGKGLTVQEKEAQQYFSKLLNWRKNNDAVHNGKFKHYAPQINDVYVYFRYNDKEKVMVILNKNAENVKLDMNRYNEMIPDTFRARDIISGKELDVKNVLSVSAKTSMILEIQ